MGVTSFLMTIYIFDVYFSRPHTEPESVNVIAAAIVTCGLSFLERWI